MTSKEELVQHTLSLKKPMEVSSLKVGLKFYFDYYYSVPNSTAEPPIIFAPEKKDMRQTAQDEVLNFTEERQAKRISQLYKLFRRKGRSVNNSKKSLTTSRAQTILPSLLLLIVVFNLL